MATPQELLAQLGMRPISNTSLIARGGTTPLANQQRRPVAPPPARPRPVVRAAIPSVSGGLPPMVEQQLAIARERGMLRPPQIVEPQPQEQQQSDGGGGGSWWGRALGAVAEPLNWLQAGGRAVTAGMQELAKALPENVEQQLTLGGKAPFLTLFNEEEDRGVWERIKDPEYGVGSATYDSGNKWIDRGFGFVGDVAFDPLTYVTAGSPQYIGKGARMAAAAKARSLGMSDDVIARAAKGVAWLDDAERETLGMGKAALRFAGVDLPGTGGIARATGRATGSVRRGITGNRYWQKIGRNPEVVKEALIKLETGAGDMSVRTAAAVVDFDKTYRMASKGVISPGEQAAGDILAKMGPDARVQLTHLVEAGRDDSGITEVLAKLWGMADQAGVKVPKRRNFMPHRWTREGQELLGKANIVDVNGRKVVLDFTKESGATLDRRLGAGVHKINGRDVDFGGGTIREINEALNKEFKTQGVKYLEDDAQKLMSAYINQIGHDVGQVTAFKKLLAGGDDAAAALRDASNEVLDEVATRTANREAAKEIRSLLQQRAADYKVAQQSSRAKANTVRKTVADWMTGRVKRARATMESTKGYVDNLKVEIDDLASDRPKIIERYRAEKRAMLDERRSWVAERDALNQRIEAANVRLAAAESKGQRAADYQQTLHLRNQHREEIARLDERIAQRDLDVQRLSDIEAELEDLNELVIAMRAIEEDPDKMAQFATALREHSYREYEEMVPTIEQLKDAVQASGVRAQELDEAGDELVIASREIDRLLTHAEERFAAAKAIDIEEVRAGFVRQAESAEKAATSARRAVGQHRRTVNGAQAALFEARRNAPPLPPAAAARRGQLEAMVARRLGVLDELQEGMALQQAALRRSMQFEDVASDLMQRTGTEVRGSGYYDEVLPARPPTVTEERLAADGTRLGRVKPRADQRKAGALSDMKAANARVEQVRAGLDEAVDRSERELLQAQLEVAEREAEEAWSRFADLVSETAEIRLRHRAAIKEWSEARRDIKVNERAIGLTQQKIAAAEADLARVQGQLDALLNTMTPEESAFLNAAKKLSDAKARATMFDNIAANARRMADTAEGRHLSQLQALRENIKLAEKIRTAQGYRVTGWERVVSREYGPAVPVFPGAVEEGQRIGELRRTFRPPKKSAMHERAVTGSKLSRGELTRGKVVPQEVLGVVPPEARAEWERMQSLIRQRQVREMAEKAVEGGDPAGLVGMEELVAKEAKLQAKADELGAQLDKKIEPFKIDLKRNEQNLDKLKARIKPLEDWRRDVLEGTPKGRKPITILSKGDMEQKLSENSTELFRIREEMKVARDNIRWAQASIREETEAFRKRVGGLTDALQNVKDDIAEMSHRAQAMKSKLPPSPRFDEEALLTRASLLADAMHRYKIGLDEGLEAGDRLMSRSLGEAAKDRLDTVTKAIADYNKKIVDGGDLTTAASDMLSASAANYANYESVAKDMKNVRQKKLGGKTQTPAQAKYVEGRLNRLIVEGADVADDAYGKNMLLAFQQREASDIMASQRVLFASELAALTGQPELTRDFINFASRVRTAIIKADKNGESAARIVREMVMPKMTPEGRAWLEKRARIELQQLRKQERGYTAMVEGFGLPRDAKVTLDWKKIIRGEPNPQLEASARLADDIYNTEIASLTAKSRRARAGAQRTALGDERRFLRARVAEAEGAAARKAELDAQGFPTDVNTARRRAAAEELDRATYERDLQQMVDRINRGKWGDKWDQLTNEEQGVLALLDADTAVKVSQERVARSSVEQLEAEVKSLEAQAKKLGPQKGGDLQRVADDLYTTLAQYSDDPTLAPVYAELDAYARGVSSLGDDRMTNEQFKELLGHFDASAKKPKKQGQNLIEVKTFDPIGEWRRVSEGLWKDGEEIVVQPEIERALNRLIDHHERNTLVKAIEQMTQFFKTYATATPGFHVRNAISAVFMNFADGVAPQYIGEANRSWAEYMKDPMGYLQRIEKSDPQKFEAFKAVFGSGAGGGFAREELGERGTGVLMHNRWTKLNRRWGNRVEGSVRLAMALDSTRGGADAWDAMNRVVRVHFDYSELSELDKNMKLMIPFWVFMSRNLPLQIQQMYTRPAMYSAFNHLMSNVGEDIDVMPQWLEERGAAVLGGSETRGFASLAPDLAHTNLQADLESFDISNPFRVLSNANPVVVGALEGLGNKNLYYDSEIGGPGARFEHALMKAIPPFAQTRRLSGTGKYQGQGLTGEKALNFIGVPYYNITPQRMASEMRRRSYDSNR